MIIANIGGGPVGVAVVIGTGVFGGLHGGLEGVGGGGILGGCGCKRNTFCIVGISTSSKVKQFGSWRMDK